MPNRPAHTITLAHPDLIILEAWARRRKRLRLSAFGHGSSSPVRNLPRPTAVWHGHLV